MIAAVSLMMTVRRSRKRTRRHVLALKPSSPQAHFRSFVLEDLYYLGVIVLMTASSWCPGRRPKEMLVRLVAWMARTLSRSKRRTIERNLDAAFGGQLTAARRREIVRGAFVETWREMFSWVPTVGERLATATARVDGLERVHAALGAGRGVILWDSAGFGRRIVAKRALAARGIALHQVHGPDDLGGFLTDNSAATWVRRAWVKRFFARCERQFVTDIVDLPRAGSLAFGRDLQARLVRNAVLCISGDGKIGYKRVPVPMLGVTEWFATGMVSLARLVGATILPLFCLQDAAGQPWVIIEPPIDIGSGEKRERESHQGVAQYAALLEQYIRRRPEAFRNWHLLGTRGVPAGSAAARHENGGD